ncbi:RNA polymerase sigma factor [soil metagenome]
MNPEALDVLIEGCCNNERSSQENLYKFFYDDMYRTCLRYTDDPHIALTILNDAFLKMFQKISQFKNTLGPFRPWLKTIVINTAIDHTRSLKKEARIIHIDHLQEAGNDDFQINYGWNYSEMQEHFRQLPAVTRVVINLFAIDGFSHKDIADQLNISEATSRWHVSEARKRLRSSMQLKPGKLAKHE